MNIQIIADIPAESVAEALFHADGHFPFDWNGWGIGVDADPAPGESIAAWRRDVREIVDDLDVH